MTTTHGVLPNLLKFKLIIKNSKSPACKWKNKKFWSKAKRARARHFPGNKHLTDEQFQDKIDKQIAKEDERLSTKVAPLMEYKNYFVKSDTGTGKTSSFADYAFRNETKFLTKPKDSKLRNGCQPTIPSTNF
jgi:hypothetical protein